VTDVISEYQKWKQQGDNLRAQAKQAMESRFRELLSEAAQIAGEYRANFGSSLKPPPSITAFRYKASSRPKGKKANLKQGTAGKQVRESSLPESPAPKPNPKIAGLQKRLTTAKKKLDEAKATGKPTKAFEDRIYELEDELRLSGHA
jgi:hypothetical protein